MKKSFLVTAPPPTPNGELHLGHLSGPYLGADVFTRAQRSFGNDVVYLCSTDDHQSYCVTKAIEEKRTVEEAIGDYSSRIQDVLLAANIRMDCFTSPRRPEHFRRVQKLFLDLYKAGKLQVNEEPTCFCLECNRYLFEAYVKGACIHCDAPSGGNYCEECGHPSDPIHLKNPQCTICHHPPVIKTFKRVVFSLEDYREELTRYYEKHSYQWKPQLKKLYSELLSKKLPDVPITNLEDWGVPVPLPDFEGHVINVWFEMLPGHMETASVWAKENGLEQDFWAKNSPTEMVQFFGFDNSFYYAVVHIAMLAALGNHKAADGLITNQFYLQDRAKFSKSRGNAIWGSEFLETEHSDWVRYYLCYSNPENRQTHFSLTEYTQIVEQRIGQEWHAYLAKLTSLCGRNSKGQEISSAAEDHIAHFRRKFSACYGVESFSLKNAADDLHQFMVGADQIIEQTQSAIDAYYFLRALAVFSAPITPIFSSDLGEYLGYQDSNPIKWECLDQAPLPVEKSLQNSVLNKLDSYENQFFKETASSILHD
ncbi:class I tRNA ligase family protein [Salinithrix halophila]|uniref:Class I tRNA ligase family protein n=1 Tax=Salinithrix halophila TaxID=1485204 RepID=A0ABV8JCE8_9BACL